MLTTNKNTPVPQQPPSYCLDHAKGQAANALWGLLFVFLGLCCGVYGYSQLELDKTGWETMEYVKMGASWVMALGLLVLGGVTIYVSLRESLQPENSVLAKSIRSQLPNPEAAPGWQELFAMVDRDLAAGANWFEKVGIGREWVLGDEATYIPNIRGVYRRNEIRHRSSGSGNRRIIVLYLVDNRQQSFSTGMMDTRELDAAIQCLRLRAPLADFGEYGDYLRVTSLSQDDWDRREQEFRRRQAERAEQSAPTPAPDGEVFGFFLVRADGQRTSRVSRQLLAEQMEALAPGQQLILNPTFSVPAGLGQTGPGVTEELKALNCTCHGSGEIWLIAILRTTGENEQHRGFGRLGIGKAEALEIMTNLLETRRAPDVFAEGWQPIQVRAVQDQGGQQQKNEPYLNITDGAGVSRKYERFSRRDVELAAQNVAEGRYKAAVLWLPPRLIFLDAGTKDDARVTIQIALPKDGAFRTYREKTTGRQAAEWFIGCLDGALPQGFERWKEVTKEWEKRAEKQKKQEKKNANKK